jgi:uncharacterized protein
MVRRLPAGALHRHGKKGEKVTLPQFPEFRLIGLDDRDLFAGAIARHPSEVCELNFANIFLWRHFERSKLTVINGNLCVLCEPPSEPAYFLQPIGGNDIEETIRTCLSFAPRLSRVEEAFAATYGGPFRCEPDRDNYDYAYLSEDLILLKGKKYDGKRNRIRKFENGSTYTYARLTRDRLPGCYELLAGWLEAKAGRDGFMANVWRDVIEQGLAHADQLELRGGVFEVGGRVAAFSLGARLTPDMAVIPVEIVNPGYEGLSQLVNREFVRREWSDCRLINREQDNGIAGLRRAKTSYHPHHFVKKCNIWG